MELNRPVVFVSGSFKDDDRLTVEMDSVPRVGDHIVISGRGHAFNGDYEVIQVVHGIDGSDYDGPVVELKPAKISLPTG